jgi:putative tryptophan/tyrosine transport system substrate-binding protein
VVGRGGATVRSGMTILSRRRWVAGMAGVGLTAAAGVGLWRVVPLLSQARAEPPLIGYLAPVAEEEAMASAVLFRDGLREQGLVEGRDLRLSFRYADGRPERLPGLVAELLALPVRMLVTIGGTPTQAARQTTDRVPIVMINAPDPVAAGWATSWAQPGGNITGLRAFVGEQNAKAVDLLVEIVPTARRLAYFSNLSLVTPTHDIVAAGAAQHALELLVGDVRVPADLEPALERVVAGGADLLIAHNVIPLNVPRERLPELARRARLPAASSAGAWTVAGFLLSYAEDNAHLFRRAAWYVARILEGVPPGELPIERPTVFQLAVNRATAAQLGLTIPEHVAAQVEDWIG